MWLGKQFVQVVLLDISAQAELETTLWIYAQLVTIAFLKLSLILSIPAQSELLIPWPHRMLWLIAYLAQQENFALPSEHLISQQTIVKQDFSVLLDQQDRSPSLPYTEQCVFLDNSVQLVQLLPNPVLLEVIARTIFKLHQMDFALPVIIVLPEEKISIQMIWLGTEE